MDEIASIRAFIRRHQQDCSSQKKAWACGTVLRHDALPVVHDLNFLRLEGECALSVGEICTAADEAMSGSASTHRQILVEHETLGRELAPRFEELGWKADRVVIMVRTRGPDLSIDTSDVVEVREPEIWPQRERLLRTYEWCDDETAAQMHAAYRIWMQASSGRDLAIRRNGVPVSFAMLLSDGEVAQIEDVATLEPWRNQGLSRAIVTRAAELAYAEGCRTVFLMADEDDWPKQLYERLGFEVVGRSYYFLKVNS